MRVTTQMLNESARKAGLPIHDKSLLNYINQGNGGNSLLGAVSGNNTQTGGMTKIQKSGFEKMEKTAGGLYEKAAVFLEKDNTVFDKARESGDNKEVLDDIRDMVESYNDTIEILSREPGAVNRLYLESLKSAAKENASLLKNVGITASQDGKLVIDEEKFKSAGLDDLEKAFGNSATFSTRTAFVAGRIEDNAAANLESVSNRYTPAGTSADNAYMTALLNRFDHKG